MDAPVWFITGCSSGIGRQVAEDLIAAGQRVAVTARRIADIADLQSDRVAAFALDVTDEASVQAAVQAALARFGRLDVVVNNAGAGLVAALEECTAAEVEQMFGTNVLGPLALIRAVAPHLRAQGSGYIMSVGSTGSVRGRPGLGIYAATKHALAGLHDALTDEMKPFGVRCTVLLLGSYRTGFRFRGMKPGEQVIDAYDATSGAVRRRLQDDYPPGFGDAATIAPVLLQLFAMPDPPRALALGADAVAGVRAKLEAMLAELCAWEALSCSAGVRPEDVAALQAGPAPAPRTG
jgi:NAD(P)-dependent dehydrogenase (short-subunit alcohol dehydrogenase family)